MAGGRFVNSAFVLPGPSHRISERSVTGELDAVREICEGGGSILYVVNHPSHSDPQFMGEVHRVLGTPSTFMAAYDVFLRSSSQAWLMQKLGCFSIDREGGDRKAISEAIRILREGELALTIFPEGNVYLMNDRVTPFLDGPAFIALKAQQMLAKEDGEVWIVPVSLKFTHLADVREKVWRQLVKLAGQSGYAGLLDPSAPVDSVVSVGSHLLAQYLGDRSSSNLTTDLTSRKPEEIRDTLLGVVKSLVSELEEKLELESDPDVFIVDRVRKARSRIHQIVLSEGSEELVDEEKIRLLSDQAMLSFRILAYVLPYLNQDPTLDRYAETVERLHEDFHSKAARPLGRRKAMAKVGDPFSVGEFARQAGGKIKTTTPLLTCELEKQIQSGIDELNENNSAPGGRLILETEEESNDEVDQ